MTLPTTIYDEMLYELRLVLRLLKHIEQETGYCTLATQRYITRLIQKAEEIDHG